MAAFYSLTTTAVVMVILVLNTDAVTDQQFQELSNFVQEQSNECKGEIQNLSTRMREQSNIMETQRKEIQDLTEEVNNMKAAIKVQNTLIQELSNINGYTFTEDVDVMQNSTLEERVTVLEIQVTDIREDIATVEQDVADLDQDVNFLFDQQIIQDERLFQLETETEGIEEEVEVLQSVATELDDRVTELEENGGGGGNSSVAELEVRVETLEGTAADHETRLIVAEKTYKITDVSLDARITALEENGGGSGNNGTIAFNARLTSAITINVGDVVIFDEATVNEGNGYDSETGVFTAPEHGWYFVSTFFRGGGDTFALFDIELNDEKLCTATADQNDLTNDSAQATCSTIFFASQGDESKVVYISGTDTDPLWDAGTYLYHGFVGFRI